MKYISRKISTSKLISRIDSNVPYPSVAWVSPVGIYETYQDALNSITNTNFPQSSLFQTYVINKVDKNNSVQGNYGNIPLPINKEKMDGVSTDVAVPFHTLNEWYWYLKNYFLDIGSDETAEKHYILETSAENLQPQQLEEERLKDEKVDEINSNFSGDTRDRGYEWLKNNLFTNGDEIAIKPSTSDPLSCGYFNIPIQITNNINDMGLMTEFNDNTTFDKTRVRDANYEIGEVYNRVDVLNSDGKVTEYENPMIITDIGDESYPIPICKQGHTEAMTTVPFATVSIDGEEKMVKGMRYDLFLANMRSTYDSAPCETVYYSPDEYIYYDRYNEITDNEISYFNTPLLKYDNGFFLINDNIYEIFENRFVTFSGDSTSAYNGLDFPVFETKAHGSETMVMMTCSIGGKTFIAKVDDNGDYYFTFANPKTCHSDSMPKCYVSEPKKYIAIDGDYVFTYYEGYTENVDLTDEDNSKTITYRRIMSYCMVEGETYYVRGEGLYQPDGVREEGDKLIASFKETYPSFYGGDDIYIGDKYVRIPYLSKAVKTNIITGYTDSKIDILREQVTAVDMLGQRLPGNFEFEYDVEAEKNRTADSGRVNTKYNEPFDGMKLDIPFRLGAVNELEELNGSIIGDIISIIKVEGFDINGNSKKVIEDDIVDMYDNYDVDDFLSYNLKNNVESVYSTDGVVTVTVTITYNIGAKLETSEDKYPMYTLATDDLSDGQLLNGIVYTETFNAVEKSHPYYVNSEDCFNVRYYDFETLDTENIVDYDYGDKEMLRPTAKFEMAVNHYVDNEGWSNEKEGFDVTNGTNVSPVFRKDASVGYSMPQNISGNIYIDRGFMSLNEKQFRLMDAKNLDGLIKTGNYWFKIEEY